MIQGFYKHYKENWYFVVGYVWNSNNGEERNKDVLYFSFGKLTWNRRNEKEFFEMVGDKHRFERKFPPNQP
jgi:hypothetical protein